MDDDLTTVEAAVVERARTWAHEEVRLMAATWEREHRFAREAFDSAAAAGLTGLRVAAEDGGLGLGPVAFARVTEEIASVDMGAAFILTVHNNLAASVATSVSAAVRDRYLPDLVAGNKVGAFALTEPDVGSDAAAITTAAVTDGDDWVIDGAKAWVTSAAEADLVAVYATTNAAAGHRGIAAFLVPTDLPGVVREPSYHMLGGHALGTGGFRFESCRVPAEAMYIKPGEGFAAALGGIDLARIVVAAICSGMMRSGLDEAVAYVRNRRAFGGRLADLQATRFTLADVATDLEAARMLTYRAARLLQNGEPASIAASHAKKFAARAAERRLADCMQVMGAAGVLHSTPLARHLTAARLTQYMDGATEIQNVVIARSLLDP